MAPCSLPSNLPACPSSSRARTSLRLIPSFPVTERREPYQRSAGLACWRYSLHPPPRAVPMVASPHPWRRTRGVAPTLPIPLRTGAAPRSAPNWLDTTIHMSTRKARLPPHQRADRSCAASPSVQGRRAQPPGLRRQGGASPWRDESRRRATCVAPPPRPPPPTFQGGDLY